MQGYSNWPWYDNSASTTSSKSEYNMLSLSRHPTFFGGIGFVFCLAATLLLTLCHVLSSTNSTKNYILLSQTFSANPHYTNCDFSNQSVRTNLIETAKEAVAAAVADTHQIDTELLHTVNVLRVIQADLATSDCSGLINKNDEDVNLKNRYKDSIFQFRLSSPFEYVYVRPIYENRHLHAVTVRSEQDRAKGKIGVFRKDLTLNPELSWVDFKQFDVRIRSLFPKALTADEERALDDLLVDVYTKFVDIRNSNDSLSLAAIVAEIDVFDREDLTTVDDLAELLWAYGFRAALLKSHGFRGLPDAHRTIYCVTCIDGHDMLIFPDRKSVV